MIHYNGDRTSKSGQIILSPAIHLEGGCLVAHREALVLAQSGDLQWCRVAGPEEGTQKLSLFYFELAKGDSEGISFANSEVVLYLLNGPLQINISGQVYDVNSHCGIHVRKGESFSLHNDCPDTTRLLASVCPGINRFDFVTVGKGNFDSRYPERIADAMKGGRQPSGDRFYRWSLDQTAAPKM